MPHQFENFVKNCFPYNTLYKWQWDLFEHLEKSDMALVIVARDHGKSVLLTLYIEEQ